MKPIVVIGAGGMLGWAVASHFARRGRPVVALTRAELDVARDPTDKLERLLDGAEAVVNCAGVIKPRIASLTIEEVLRVNTVFPRNLAKLAARLGLPAIHITTDCVYSGRRGGYTEEDPFDADDVYGMSKNGGDVAELMTLRTSIVGEERGTGRSLLEWARSQAGKQVNGFTNHRWNGVTTLHLGEVAERILDEGLHARGIFHVHSPEVVTKAELLRLLSEAYDLRLDVREVAPGEACDRSLSSVHPLSARLCTKPMRRQLDEMRRFFAEVRAAG